jgi:predicted phosphodiesterase
VRKFLQFLFRKPVAWLANKVSSAPKIVAVHRSLTRLLKHIEKAKEKKGIVLTFDATKARVVIMSDLHKGAADEADDFLPARNNYLEAACYYNDRRFTYIALGDVEELWENDINKVYKNNHDSFLVEKEFVADNRFVKLFGNHDMYWVNTLLPNRQWLEKMYGTAIPVYEALIVRIEGLNNPLQFFLTHGHQGDAQSDGNRFSRWFVANIWGRVQSYLDVKINSPSKDYLLRDKHNIMMYEWTLKHPATALITGHTHKPVFGSLNHLEKLKREWTEATKANNTVRMAILEEEMSRRQQEYNASSAYIMKRPSYFNSGCCCFNDGDITAIEIEDAQISLVKWYTNKDGSSTRTILESAPLAEIAAQIQAKK